MKILLHAVWGEMLEIDVDRIDEMKPDKNFGTIIWFTPPYDKEPYCINGKKVIESVETISIITSIWAEKGRTNEHSY